MDTNKDIADPELNPDEMEKELAASFLCHLNSSANGILGTVAGTVINTFFYNSWEAADVAAKTTDNCTPEDCDIETEETTGTAKVFDPLIGGATPGICGAEEVHWIGCGKTCACVAINTEMSLNGKS